MSFNVVSARRVPAGPTDRTASPSSPTIDAPPAGSPAPPSIADALIAGKDRISDPDRWCQGTVQDAAGRRCALGAFAGGTATAGAYELLAAVMGSTITGFNDSHTHAEVLSAFDRAIYCALEF